MAFRARLLLLPLLLLSLPLHAADARFDLVGPSIDVRVTRGDTTLPIASVPNLQPGDKLWLHPDLPATQSVHYLLICVFLRGTTNPPPDDWFIRIQTWDKKVRDEGALVTVPAEAQQAVLFLAPETGGDFTTLRSAVQGRPGVFVRASQDLAEAGFEQARIEKYLASIRRVPPSDPVELQKHSDLLARTLALKPNPDCFKQPVDIQFTCLTQTGSQTLLDDGHGQSIVSALSSGPNSDFINAASSTNLAGGGLYSAYVGAIVDLVRIMGNQHTAQYQYIPAIAFPQQEALNLRLNTPPSFHNPKSVLVIGLPSVQSAIPPPLRPADAKHVACLLEPSVVLPIEGAPLVFSTAFAHDLVLHFNTPPGAPAEPDIPLHPDAYQGGLVLQQTPEHQIAPLDQHFLHAPPLLPNPFAHPSLAPEAKLAPTPAAPKPITLTGTIKGEWGFDPFTGPTVPLQQLPGGDWHIVNLPPTLTAGTTPPSTDLIAGRSAQLLITSTGSACVHTITARPTGSISDLPIAFTPAAKPDQPNLLQLTLPLEHAITPGDLHLAIQQYGQPKADDLSARTFAEPAHIASVEIHAGDRTLILSGTSLAQVATLTLGDLVFAPASTTEPNSLTLALPPDAPAPPTQVNEHLIAAIALHDGRTLSLPLTVSAPRPVITLLSKSIQPATNAIISLPNPDDLPLSQTLTFTLKTPTPFPRNGQIEIETLDGTLRTVLTLAPSGGLLLQDPRTIVATLDPLRCFGPSAFGPLHLRAVFPAAEPAPGHHAIEAATAPPSQTSATTAAEPPSSDWLPLATLVRLPILTQLDCPTDPTQPCTLTGANLFLIDAISIDPAFVNPIPVPDGYTGTTLTLPQPAATIFLHLRDDPAPIDSAIVPTPPSPEPSPAPRLHPGKSASKPTTRPQPPAQANPAPPPDLAIPSPQPTTPPPASTEKPPSPESTPQP